MDETTQAKLVVKTEDKEKRERKRNPVRGIEALGKAREKISGLSMVYLKEQEIIHDKEQGEKPSHMSVRFRYRARKQFEGQHKLVRGVFLTDAVEERILDFEVTWVWKKWVEQDVADFYQDLLAAIQHYLVLA